MKKIFVLLVIVVALSMGARAQVEVSELFIPSAPGFILADKGPASVEKPTTPKAFGVSLLNLWQGGAVEATPFWFTNKPLYTYEEWIKKKVTIVETFNLSAATFRLDSTSALSVGFRTQIFRIYDKPQRERILAQEQEIIDALTTRTPAGGIDVAKVQEASNKLDRLEAKGFVALEIAGAIIGSSNTNSFKGLSSNKSGVWANFRWSPSNSILDFVALARYSWANNAAPVADSDSAFFDYGVAANYESKSFNLAFEYVNRRDIAAKKNLDRLAFTATYQLNANLAFVASFGKNFAKEDNIITVFGINVGNANQKMNNSGSEE